VSGSPLRVVRVATVPGGLELTLAWEPDGCDSVEFLARGTNMLEIVGRAARDTIPLGDPVTYTLAASGCSWRQLTVMGRPVEPLLPRWEKSELAIDFAVPLADGPPPEVLLRIGNRLEPPRAVHTTREGKQILVVPGKEPPDSVIVIGAWQADGLPLGGSARSAARVPPFPGEVSPPVLAEVVYDVATHALRVTLGGDTLACNPSFLLLPEERSFPETHRSGSFDLELGAALASGTHTLEMHAPCLDAEGSARSFNVGRVMYPNPVRSGQELVLEGLEAGSRIALVDVSGEERLAWHTAGPVETRSLGDLPPGLYFVRFETARGELAGIEKLAIIR
ncbi:MAG TPA: T9SS type A sorting domain-containing protein, partial [Candidatus Eisenbacteria bacterium]|nr:T9SS type A sorting domain-containing protein [Candidatus Eisenbacteria bacterium]